MSWMTKWYGWCMCFLALVLAGCASFAEATPTAQPAEGPARAHEGGVYYFLAGNNADPFYVSGVAGFKAAAEEVGMDWAFVGPMDLNLNEQMKTFDELLAKPDTAGIFYYPMDFNAAQPRIEEAKAKGIPIVIGAADSPFKTRDAFIGVSDEVFGTSAGAFAEKLTGCKGKVGAIALVQANTDARIAAYFKYLKQACPDQLQAERVSHDGSVQSATTALDAYLAANPDMTLIYFADGSGGQQGTNWKQKQDAGLETMFLATDTTPLALQAVKDGIFAGVIGQDTFVEEYWGVMLMDALNRGVSVPDTLYLGAVQVDQSNVDAIMAELQKRIDASK